MGLSDLLHGNGEWLRGAGPESDVIISSRIRLARNLAAYPFMSRVSSSDRERIAQRLLDSIRSGLGEDDLLHLPIGELEEVDRLVLVERHLISRELAEAEGTRAVVFDNNETFSLMINEEDHLRIQVMHAGFDLDGVWRQTSEIDDAIEANLTYAFDAKLGYLTACPTNVGTGLRVSVMMHLPGLVISRQIEKVFRSLQKINLAVRGLYGEGSQAMGDFYQISNQITLGKTEQELIDKVKEVVPVIVDYERQSREFLLAENRENLTDRIFRALGILKTAQTISSEETMHHLSGVRLGVNLGLIDEVTIEQVNEFFLKTQPAHLQKMAGTELKPSDRDIYRAKYIREFFED